MNLGNDPADQIVRYTLEGTEIALKLSGLAAKNFALFVYAVLKDQKKTHGKTRLVRMLREQRPFKFFKIPSELMREFAKEAKGHGLLYVPIRNKRDRQMIEIVAFADDAAKIQRIYDNLGLDYVKAQIGEAAVVEKAPVQEMKNQEVSAPAKQKRFRQNKARRNLKSAAWRMTSISALSGRMNPKILSPAGRRNQHPRLRKRICPSLPRPAEAYLRMGKTIGSRSESLR